MNRSFIIPLAIIGAGLILAIAIYQSMGGANPSLSVGSGNPSAIAPLSASDHIVGSPTAPLIIIEYSDFDCEHCKTFNLVLHQIVNDYGAGGKVAWAFRNFALTELYPNSKKHAEAAECVAKVAGTKAYFIFNDLLFTNQPADPIKYSEYAKKAGAAPDAVASCIQQAATNGIGARVDAERAQALAAGARGAPFSLLVVAGKTPFIIDGAASYADLKDQLDLALKALAP